MRLTLHSSFLALVPGHETPADHAAGAAGDLTVAGAWLAPQPNVHEFQVREQALRARDEALGGQQLAGYRLAGYRLDGFRVLPSSVVQTGTRVTAGYAVREGGPAAWNSGDIIQVRCRVQAGQAQLHHVTLLR